MRLTDATVQRLTLPAGGAGTRGHGDATMTQDIPGTIMFDGTQAQKDYYLPRLAIGWVMGVVVSMLGMYFSVAFDLPTGATIVCTFGLVLILMAAARPLIQSHAVS